MAGGSPLGHNLTMRISLAASLVLALTATARADQAADLKACNGGKAARCEVAAERLLNGTDGVEKDPAKALGLLDKACTLKSSRACNNAGTAWSDGKEGAPSVDHAKARKYYEKACALKNGLGCFNLGNVHRLGEDVPVDLKLAFANFKKSCELDEAKGCTELGIMYYEGKAVPKDVKKATETLEKACNLKSETACKNVEILKKAATKTP